MWCFREGWCIWSIGAPVYPRTGHGKKRSSGVSQLALGFKVPTGTLLGCLLGDYLGIPLEYPWKVGRILTSLSSFLISLLGYLGRIGVLRSYIPIPISLLLGSVLLG